MLVAEGGAGALQEPRGNLFFITSVENRESLCIPSIIQVHVHTYTHTRGTRIPSKSLVEGG